MAWEPDYATLAELREYATSSADPVDDAQIQLALTAASRAVDGFCRRQFGLVAAPEERRYTPTWSATRRRWVVEVDDFMTTTGMVVNLDLDDDDTFDDAVTGFTKLPFNAPMKGRPWERLVLPESSNGNLSGKEGEVAAVVRWGWTTVPVVPKQATLLQGSRFLIRRDSPYGVTGSPDAGTGELRLLSRVDPDVAVMLRDYQRGRWRVG